MSWKKDEKGVSKTVPGMLVESRLWGLWMLPPTGLNDCCCSDALRKAFTYHNWTGTRRLLLPFRTGGLLPVEATKNSERKSCTKWNRLNAEGLSSLALLQFCQGCVCFFQVQQLI